MGKRVIQVKSWLSWCLKKLHDNSYLGFELITYARSVWSISSGNSVVLYNAPIVNPYKKIVTQISFFYH